MSQQHPRHRAAAELEHLEKSFWQDFGDAVSVRTVSLIAGVLLLQLGFVLSYVGAFHHPTPHRISVAVVAPAAASAKLVDELNALPGQPLHAAQVLDGPAAMTMVRHGSTSAALMVSPGGATDSLLVATGGSSATATAVETVISKVEAAQHRTATVTDVVPAQEGDARGLSGFYLVVGWLVGGYLVSALLGVATGARPATGRRALIRLLAVALYAVVSGLGGAAIVGPLLGALTGHLLALWALGALLVFCAAAVTMAFQVLFGVLGIGVTVLLFVVLGNPSAGGAYPPALLPPFWRAISSAIPNGAGVQAVRRIIYFGGYGITHNILVIAVWALAGAVVAFVVAKVRAGPAAPPGTTPPGATPPATTPPGTTPPATTPSPPTST